MARVQVRVTLTAEQQRVAAHDKRVTTCKARAALRGITLHVGTSANGQPEFIFFRGSLMKAMDSLDAAEAWLSKVGA